MMKGHFAHVKINWGDSRVVAPGALAELDFILGHPELFPAARDISTVPGNYSSSKRVYLLTLPPPFATQVVYKVYYGKAPWRFYLQKSLARREYDNYGLLQNLQIPVPERLGCGERRCGPHLQEAFIATRFLPDMVDGRAFMPGGPLRAESAERHEFCQKNLLYLARAHGGQYFHYALHPRNVLWNRQERRAVWIDVARGRPQWKLDMPASVIRDLYTFFWDMRLPRAEVEELLRYYQAQPGGDRLAGDELNRRLHRYRRRTVDGITSVLDF